MEQEEISSLRLESLILQGSNSEYFPELVTQVEAVGLSLGFRARDTIINNLTELWLPLALTLINRQKQLKRTFIQGIVGSQGTGKTTLCKILQPILSYLGLAVATLSLDDFYLTYEARVKLRQQDPRLIWRGPPGTHDLALGINVIDQCLQGDRATKILIPRFDKSAYSGAGDRTMPETISKPDILLFEGWFVGFQPLTAYPEDFPEPIVREQDRQFAQDNNQRLQAYVPLWSKLDSLIVLDLEDYHLSQQWRREAEQKMIAQGKTGMSEQECDRFVEYFWHALHPELYLPPLIKTADLVIKINSDRSYTLINH